MTTTYCVPHAKNVVANVYQPAITLNQNFKLLSITFLSYLVLAFHDTIFKWLHCYEIS